MNQTIATHRNSQGERLHIRRIVGGAFDGELLLVIQDDPPPRGTNKDAPMLLDESTQTWLVAQLLLLKESEGTLR